MHVVATAGHVDHGKSTLVKALTGTDPDRFAEEKARGLTIDLGFAWTELPSGRELAFVDVPGHVRFLKNMLAGVGALNACMFVVAATEGWKPQSEEHLRILELLGVSCGVVALTKVGLVDDDTRELARLELDEELAGSFLAGAEVVEVDAVAGTGLPELVGALDRMLARMPAPDDQQRPRLWIDRVFAARGSGTVVTGTLTGGSLSLNDDLVLSPLGTRVRVRGLQSLGRSHDSVGPGSRVAVNLSGIAHTDVTRGQALVVGGQWEPARIFDASLNVLDALDHDVSRRGAFHLYLGSGEHPVQLRVLGTERIKPGARANVRLRLRSDVTLTPGDRFILRESGRDETVGGGEILEVAPVTAASKARPSRSVDRVVAERRWIDADLLYRLTGERRAPDIGRWVVDPETRAATEAELTAAVEGAGALGLDTATLDDRGRALLALLDGIVVDGGRARMAGATDTLGEHPFIAALAAAPFEPPDGSGVEAVELRELVRRGLVLEYEGVYFAPSALEEAARIVAGLLRQDPEGFTVAQARDALGTTRKHALPILGILDATGMTRRRGDFRVAGPRLPPPA